MEQGLTIELLGQFRVCGRGGRVPELDTPRLRALLGRLVLQPGRTIDRAELAFQFWPDSTDARARGNLRKLLHVLLQRLPNSELCVAYDRRTLTWRRDAPYLVDVHEFERHSTDMASSRQWRRAMELYRGPLLPGSYEEWVLAERDRLHARYLGVLDRLVGHHEARGEFAEALALLERRLREAPFAEEAWERLIRLYAADGDRAGALEAYERCRQALANELGAEPSASIEALHDRLLRARHPAGLRRALPLIGRQQEVSDLRRWSHEAFAQDKRILIVIEGEAGIGKTRLAEELTEWALQQGVAVAWGHAYEPDRGIAFAPVRGLLRNQRPAPDASNLPQAWQRELARLLPEFTRPHAADPTPAEWQPSGGEPPADAWRRQELFAALAHAVTAVGDPLVIVADDLQWWDGASLAWLHYLFAHGSDGPLIVLGTLRPEEDASPALPVLIASLQARDAVWRFELGPLGEQAARHLMAEATDDEVPTSEARRAYAETEGNPLFVLEWVQARAAGLSDTARAFERHLDPLTGLPGRIHGMIMGRLLALSDVARQVADAAAVLGRTFRWPLIRRVTDLPDRALVNALDELCRRRVLREYEGGGYDFAHGRIRDVVNARLSAARRYFLHGRAAAALEALYGDDARVAAQLGDHYQQAGRLEEAAAMYGRAARQAVAVYANEQAEALYRKALTAIAAQAGGDGPAAAGRNRPDESGPAAALMAGRHRVGAGGGAGQVAASLEASLWEGLADLQHHLGRHAEAAASFGEALRAAADEPDPVREARLLRKIGNAAREEQRYGEALDLYDRAEARLGQAGVRGTPGLGDPTTPRAVDASAALPGADLHTALPAVGADAALPVVGADAAPSVVEADTMLPNAGATTALLDVQFERLHLYYRAGRLREMTATAAVLLPLVERSTDQAHRVRYHHALATMLHRRDRFVTSPEVIDHARAGLAAALATGDPRLIAAARFSLGFVLLWWGDLDAGHEQMEAGLEGADTTGDLLLQVRSLTYLGFSARLRGLADQAAGFTARALEFARRAELREYVASGLGQRAWVAWSRGDRGSALADGRRALALWDQGEFAFPFQWSAAWPLLALALEDGQVAEAIPLARRILLPEQQRQPAGLTRPLRAGVTAWRGGRPKEAAAALERALEQARGAGRL